MEPKSHRFRLLWPAGELCLELLRCCLTRERRSVQVRAAAEEGEGSPGPRKTRTRPVMLRNPARPFVLVHRNPAWPVPVPCIAQVWTQVWRAACPHPLHRTEPSANQAPSEGTPLSTAETDASFYQTDHDGRELRRWAPQTHARGTEACSLRVAVQTRRMVGSMVLPSSTRMVSPSLR